MHENFPFVFLSGVSEEFKDERIRIKNFVKECLNLDILIFEDEKIPGTRPTIEECRMWGLECDLFLLLAGDRYGNMCDEGISFTEIEYNAAFSNDPNKIRVFLNLTDNCETSQIRFIEKISSGVDGRRYVKVNNRSDLDKLISQTIVGFLLMWIVDSTTPEIEVKCFRKSFAGVISSRSLESSMHAYTNHEILVSSNHDENILLIDPVIIDGEICESRWDNKLLRAGDKPHTLGILDFMENKFLKDGLKFDELEFEFTFELHFKTGGKKYRSEYRVNKEKDQEPETMHIKSVIIK